MVLVVLIVLVTLGSLGIARVRQSNNAAACGSNLRYIAMALRQYAESNGDYLPYSDSGQTWESLLLTYVPRSMFRCPTDQELFPLLGSSYDWRDTGPMNTTPSSLAGRPLSSVTRMDVAVCFEAVPGWHRPGSLLAAQMDGSTMYMEQEQFFKNLTWPVR